MSLQKLSFNSLRVGFKENCYKYRNKIEIQMCLERTLKTNKLLFSKSELKRLLYKVEDNIGEEFTMMIDKEEFLDLNEIQLHVLLSMNSLNVLDEDPVLKGLLSWINHNPTERSKELPKLLELIRIPNLTPDYLQDLKNNFKDCEKFSSKIDRFLQMTDEDTKNHNNEFSKLKPRDGEKVILALSRQDRKMRYFDFKKQEWIVSSINQNHEMDWAIWAGRNRNIYSLIDHTDYDEFFELRIMS